MRRVGGGSEDEDDVTSGGGGGVTSGHDLCELRGHVTCRDRSLLIGIVHYSTTW